LCCFENSLLPGYSRKGSSEAIIGGHSESSNEISMDISVYQPGEFGGVTEALLRAGSNYDSS
jgi:hypothetical protein